MRGAIAWLLPSCGADSEGRLRRALMSARRRSKSSSLSRSWEMWEFAAQPASAFQSVHAAGMSERVPFGNITRTRRTPRRRILVIAASDRPSNACRLRVITTDFGRSWRWVVCRVFLRCHVPRINHPVPRAPYRGQAHPAPDCEVAQGRHHRRWTRNAQSSWRSRRGGYFTNPCQRLPDYAYDLWVQRWRQTKANGDMIVVRFADDQIVGFEHEAKAFLHDLHERLRAFERALHPDKTRLIRFGRDAAKQRGAWRGKA